MFFPPEMFRFYPILCICDFSRLNFTAELSMNLVYNSIFAIDYDHIFWDLLFFFIMKLY